MTGFSINKMLVTSASLLIAFCVGGCGQMAASRWGRSSQVLAKCDPKKVALMLPMRGRWGAEARQVGHGVQSGFYRDLQAQNATRRVCNLVSPTNAIHGRQEGWQERGGQPNLRFNSVLAQQVGGNANHVPNLTEPAEDERERELRILDSSNVAVASLYRQAIADGSEIVIGPLTKMEVASIGAISELSIPVIALNNSAAGSGGGAINVTDASANPVAPVMPTPSNLHYFGPSPEGEIEQLVARLEDIGASKVAVIVGSNKSAKRLAALLETRLTNRKARREARREIEVAKLALTAQDNLSWQLCHFLAVDEEGGLCSAKERKKRNEETEGGASELARKDLEAVVLLSEPAVTAQLVPLLHFYYIEDVPILGLSNSFDLGLNLTDLEGLEFLDMPHAVLAERTAPTAELGKDAYSEEDGGLKADAQVPAKRLRKRAKLGATGAANHRVSQDRRLEAIGMDAYWLASHFNRFMSGALPVWDGASGRLQLLKDGRIFRQLRWFKVQDGQLKAADNVMKQ